jgi:hypothetical protein
MRKRSRGSRSQGLERMRIRRQFRHSAVGGKCDCGGESLPFGGGEHRRGRLSVDWLFTHKKWRYLLANGKTIIQIGRDVLRIKARGGDALISLLVLDMGHCSLSSFFTKRCPEQRRLPTPSTER